MKIDWFFSYNYNAVHCWIVGSIILSYVYERLLQDIDFPGGRVEFIPEMKFISESVEERIPCYRVLDDNGKPLVGQNFVQVLKSSTYHFIIFACSEGTYQEMKLMDINNIRSARKLLWRCTLTWLLSDLWILSSMKHKDKVEYRSMWRQSERRLLILLQLQLLPWTMLFSLRFQISSTKKIVF